MHKLLLRTSAVVLAAFVASCSRSARVQTAPAPTPRPPVVSYASGREVIAAMRERYSGKWYSTITFTQATSRLAADGQWNVQTWYESGSFPGNLRIDFEPLSAGNGVLYARDSVFTVRNGKPLAPAAGINDLLLLGFDVYFNSPDRTIAILRKEGFDVDKVHVDSLDGRRMLVVGAAKGDTVRKQFWIDAERLYFVRTIERMPANMKFQDVRFMNYRAEGAAWVAPRVEIHSDGKLIFHEDYTNIHTGMALDDALFHVGSWKTAKHWLVP